MSRAADAALLRQLARIPATVYPLIASCLRSHAALRDKPLGAMTAQPLRGFHPSIGSLADAWLRQRLHDRSVVRLLIVCAVGGLGLVLASVALTTLLLRWHQRARCKVPAASGCEEQAFLRSPASAVTSAL